MEMQTKLVFDPRIWGGKDRGDNSHCWKPGLLIRIYTHYTNNDVADILWLHNDTVTHGHFINNMKEYKA